MSKLLLIDGNSIMNRGYFALPKTLTARNGIHTNAILGFLNVFYKIYDEEKPDHIAVAFDVHEPTFRHKMYAEYKGTRHPMDDELREQFPLIKDILKAMGITCVEKGGYEADDIIGTYSRQGIAAGMDVTILSGDRDLLQLATDKVLVRIPKTKAGKTTVENYYDKDVMAEYGVTPIEFIEMKGLMGDTSDNIPGVQGIGPKTASQIIQKYHSIEAALEDIENVKPDKARKNLDEMRDMALFSRDLATIKLDCDLEKSVQDMVVGIDVLFGQRAYDMFSELGLNSVLKRFEDKGEVVKKELELETVDISYQELVEVIKTSVSDKTNKNMIGFYPVVIDGQVQGGAVSLDDKKIYIIRDTVVSSFVSDVEKYAKIAINNIKDYIALLGIKEESNVFDVAVAAYLVDPLAGGYTYDKLATTYLEIDVDDEKSLLGKKDITIFSFDEPEFRKYLAYNAYVSYAVSGVLKDKLAELGEEKLYDEIEYPTIFVLRDMEDFGIRVDSKSLHDYGNELDVQIKQLEEDITELAGESFNINSPKQLGVILFEKLGLKSGKKTKSGYSTSVDVLGKLKDEHPIIPKILEYRSLTKLKSTYVDGLTGTVRSDERIHSTFNQTVTATGRLSSTEPNLQNIPARTALGREIRKAFIPADGYTFVDADYSQIELRVMAAISEDESLIKAFNESKDIHAITAAQVFGVDIDDVTPDLRRKAKAVNFGIIYGISSFGLGEDLGISRNEAKEYIEKYFLTYPKIKNYLDESVKKAKELGYVKTMMNRIRPIPELSSSNFMQRSFGERVAMNSPIQGTAADIIKLAMINVRRELKERNLNSRLILQIHDELLIEAENSEIEVVTELLTRNMENAVKLSVPMYVDVHTGESLYEAK
ncbi:MAG: DNA polymerase I [Eubacterium sp.]|nr:DNA polymerase I [Eubacterium sp.]